MKKTRIKWFLPLLITSAIVFLSACSAEDDESSISTSVPAVASVSPVDSSTDVALDVTMRVSFNKSINPTSILTNTESTDCSQTIQVSADDFSTCLILKAPDFEYLNTTVSFQADAELDKDKTYKIRVTTAAADTAENHPAAAYTMTTGFTTVSGDEDSGESGGGASGVSMSLFDTDMDAGELKGDLLITKATDESEVDEYRLYWGSSSSEKVTGENAIATFNANGSNQTHSFSADSSIPSGGTHLLVYTAYEGTEATTPTAFDIPDGVVERLSDINPDAGSSYPYQLTAMNNVLYFFAQKADIVYNLFRSDGTTSGTYQVNTTNPHKNESPGNIHAAVVGNTLFYTAASGDSNNWELWKSDGTDSGTNLLHEINTGASSSAPQMLTPMGTELAFRASDGTEKLFKTDGTTLTPITDKKPESELVYLDGILYFNADGGSSQGAELWKSNGNINNLESVKDINTEFSADSYIGYMTVFNGALFFSANNGSSNGAELWKSDGSTDGTVMVQDIYPGYPNKSSSPHHFVAFNNELYFGASSEFEKKELWKTDGNTASKVTTFYTGSGADIPMDYAMKPAMVATSTALFLEAGADSSNRELWKTDGTTTGQVIDLPGEPTIRHMIAVGDRVFFSANGDSAGRELWVSDGTASGTVRLTDLNGSGNSIEESYANMLLVDGNLFFVANDGVKGAELWHYYLK